MFIVLDGHQPFAQNNPLIQCMVLEPPLRRPDSLADFLAKIPIYEGIVQSSETWKKTTFSQCNFFAILGTELSHVSLCRARSPRGPKKCPFLVGTGSFLGSKNPFRCQLVLRGQSFHWDRARFQLTV